MKIFVGILLIILLLVVLRIGELYTQLGRYQKYWDKVNQKPQDKNNLLYVALGDSAAQGIGASSPDKGYVGLIAKELSKNQPVHVINLSKSGASINDVADNQLPKYEGLKLDDKNTVITLDVGANDVVRSDLSSFEKDMDNLMSKLPKHTIIADVPSFKGSRYGRLEERVNRANEIMYKLAKKHGFELVGVHDNVAGNSSIRAFAADYFHPSDFGYQTNWANPFINRIKNTDKAL